MLATFVSAFLGGTTRSTPAAQRKLDAILERLADAGYQVIMERCEQRPERFLPLLREFVQIRIRGLVIALGMQLWGDSVPVEVQAELEQLRALHLGMCIKVAQPKVRPGAGVDTEDDLRRADRWLTTLAVDLDKVQR